jgi:hypothetical protein
MDTTLEATTPISIPCCVAKVGAGEIGAPADPSSSAMPPTVYAQLGDAHYIALAQVRSNTVAANACGVIPSRSYGPISRSASEGQITWHDGALQYVKEIRPFNEH